MRRDVLEATEVRRRHRGRAPGLDEVDRRAPGVEVDVGGTKFKLFTEGENAWTGSPDEDAKLIGALRAGSSAVISGRCLKVTGRPQRDGDVTHVVADAVEDISPLLDEIVGIVALPAPGEWPVDAVEPPRAPFSSRG